MKLKSADETAEIMLDMLLEDLSVKSGEEFWCSSMAPERPL